MNKFKDPDYEKIPEDFRISMDAYMLQGVHPGAFLWSLLANDLKQAMDHADGDVSIAVFRGLVKWVTCRMPAAASGSAPKVEDWRAHKGLAKWENKFDYVQLTSPEMEPDPVEPAPLMTMWFRHPDTRELSEVLILKVRPVKEHESSFPGEKMITYYANDELEEDRSAFFFATKDDAFDEIHPADR